MKKKLDFSTLNTSRYLAKKNKTYLDLQSVVNRARAGFVSEQSRLVSKPAKESAAQFLRQLDLIVNMVGMPHLLLVTMEGSIDGWRSAFEVVLGGVPKVVQEESRRRFEAQTRNAMRRFFSLDGYMSGALSRPWLFAITVYIWTAFESLASDLWANSLNLATTLAQKVLTTVSNDTDGSGLSRRHIDVGLAAKYGFDLRGCLGSVLRSKFDFTSFDGIAAAYEHAFGPSQNLQDLADSLKRLEQIRHLIVHRGGITDEKFLKYSKIKARPNSALRPTVEQVRDYMVTMTLGSVALLRSVDDWFTSKQQISSE
jgi:hypothetical protein